MGARLSDGTEVLFRQVHPNFLDKGEPSSNRFLPSSADENQLSVDRSAMTTASAAHALYTQSGRQSGAVFGVSVSEFGGETVECFHDPIEANGTQLANPAHALANYSKMDSKAQKAAAQRLKKLAIARGCLFVPA